jgi:predicted aspartyl protease
MAAIIPGRRQAQPKKTLTLFLTAWLLGVAGPAAAQQCRPFASLPLLLRDERVLVEISVNDQPVLFALDTGAANSVMSTALVQRLGLPTSSFRALGARDIGGGGTEKLAHNVRISLGGRRIVNTYSWRGYPVTDLGVDGLLGGDLLRGFDVDLDFTGGRMGLFSRGACDGAPPGFGPSSALSTAGLGSSAFGRLSRIRIPVRLDGREFWAIVDTGAARSYFAASQAFSEFGLDIAKMDAGRARGAYGGALRVAPHDFRTLQVGAVSLPNPRLSLTMPDRGFEEAPIILGLEQLRHLRLFMAFDARRLYVAPAQPS